MAALCARPLHALVNHSSLPEDPVRDLALDVTRPIVYVANSASPTDLWVLARCCAKLGLPSPLAHLQVHGQQCPAHVGLVARTDNTAAWSGSAVFAQLMKWHAQHPELDVQMVAVAMLWGRDPGLEGAGPKAALEPPVGLRKLWTVLSKGRENRVRFSPPVSLRKMADRYGRDPQVLDKLVRVARQHFGRQQKAAQGPGLPNRGRLLEEILASALVQEQLALEAQQKGMSPQKAQARAREMLQELAAKFSYRVVRAAYHVLGWFWNRLYRGIRVQGAERVRQLTQDGHVVVYLPCHRSHMDYLLLSYVIYEQGLMPPHIAAGVNLNFWPAGPILRRGGAFFIRRSFRGDPLYSTVFREYLGHLFARGYPIEFFPEGTRSRTGRLLTPMTGLLAMMLQTMRKGLDRPVTVVPVYLGYEHVMEVGSYHRELSGGHKEKESMGQVLSMLRKLRNYGKGYVNFGQPLTLHRYLDAHQSDWREQPQQERPEWLAPTVAQLARELMGRINASASLNGMTMAAMALLASEQRALPREMLVRHMAFCLDLARAAPYSPEVSLPEEDAGALLTHALALGKLKVHPDSFGDVVSVSPGRALELTYYRNTVLHLFVLPSLLARMLLRVEALGTQALSDTLGLLYPLLQSELFLHWSPAELHSQVVLWLSHWQQAGVVAQDAQGLWQPQRLRAVDLHLLGQVSQESVQRLAIAGALVQGGPDAPAEDDKTFKAKAKDLSTRFGLLHGVRSPEFFDAKLALALHIQLRAWPAAQRLALRDALAPLLNPSERLTLGV